PYYGGFYGYPWYGYGFSLGFGFAPYWGYWGYPYSYGYPPYSYYDRYDPNDYDDPDYDRDYPRSRRDPRDDHARCDYRYEDTCGSDDDQRYARPSNGTPGSSSGTNYVTGNVGQ